MCALGPDISYKPLTQWRLCDGYVIYPYIYIIIYIYISVTCFGVKAPKPTKLLTKYWSQQRLVGVMFPVWCDKCGTNKCGKPHQGLTAFDPFWCYMMLYEHTILWYSIKSDKFNSGGWLSLFRSFLNLYAVYRFTVTYFKTPYATLGAPPQCLASARRKPGQQQTWGDMGSYPLVIF